MDPDLPQPRSPESELQAADRPRMIAIVVLAAALLILLVNGRLLDVNGWWSGAAPATQEVTEQQPAASTDPYAAQPYEGWTTFRDPNNDLSFMVPPGYAVDVSRSAEMNTRDVYSITAVSDQSPAVQIVFDRNGLSLSFFLWENPSWPYYHGVVSSFAFDAE